MVIFSNCKINLGLQIVSKREDGFHNIASFFYPVPWKDAIEMVRAEQFLFSKSGLPVEGSDAENLCVKAWHLLQRKYDLPPVHLHLHKVVPTGAGLGGGSADAAMTLKLVNKEFALNLAAPALIELALGLGSDCPFFISNSPAMATGRGEILSPASLDLSAYQVMIVHPGIHVNTSWAFRLIDQTAFGIEFDLYKSISEPVVTWKDTLFNDFEPIVFGKYPEIAAIKDQLYQTGAIYASMSGSGSAVYGIFEKNIKLPLTAFESYKTFVF